MLLADRGYDADWIRALASEQGAWANIPPKRNRKEAICFSPYFYRARNLVERFFNKIKQCRRIATRYDRLAANYLAFIKLASIRIWLRAYPNAPRASLMRDSVCFRVRARHHEYALPCRSYSRPPEIHRLGLMSPVGNHGTSSVDWREVQPPALSLGRIRLDCSCGIQSWISQP
jgi:transposase